MATNQMRREAAKRKLERQRERREEQARKRKRNVVITVGAVLALVAVLGIVALNVTGGDPAPPPPPPVAAPNAVTPATIPTQAVALAKRPTPLAATVDCAYKPDPQGAAKPNTPPQAKGVSTQGTVTMTLQTPDGPIPMTLDRSVAPCTVNSMTSLAKQGYFDNTACHRLTTEAGLQVLQCGDPTGKGNGGPGYTTPDELFPGITYGRGVLAMANTGQPNSGGSQFFIVYGDAQLPPQYTVFGSVPAPGLQVVDTIAKRGYDKASEMGAGGGTPVKPVTISKATVS